MQTAIVPLRCGVRYVDLSTPPTRQQSAVATGIFAL